MTTDSRNQFSYYLEISKLKIMIPVSLTGFTGYFIFNPHFSLKLILVSIGVMLMGIAASVLNQIQEIDIDRLMNRTKRRPVTSGKISITHATIFFLINLSLGLSLLYFAGNSEAVFISLITILWYNGIYTYSKRITAFAVVPGAITGALPPLIGWVAAGGSAWDKPIIFLEFLFFIGQIPHFWLLILKYGEEYQNAGIPSLTKIFNISQINRLTFTWIVFSVVAALFLCYFEIIVSNLIIVILLFASVFIFWQIFDLVKMHVNSTNYKKYSIILDSYFLLVLLLLIIDRIITNAM